MAHRSSYWHYVNFLTKYAEPGQSILDVGGEGGFFKEFADKFGFPFTTLNCGEADINVKDTPFAWPIADNTYDLVISSSTFEHVNWYWETFREMCRVCKTGGMIYVSAPSTGPRHYEIDFWRFQGDAMAALAAWGKVELVKSFIDDGPEADQTWRDAVGIFKKL